MINWKNVQFLQAYICQVQVLFLLQNHAKGKQMTKKLVYKINYMFCAFVFLLDAFGVKMLMWHVCLQI